MGETIENILINDLKEGNIFDKDELIISLDSISMTTIRRDDDKKSGSEEIRYFIYDINKINEEKCSLYNNGYGEVDREDRFYNRYKQKLKKARVWK